MKRLRILHVLFSSRVAGSERYCADLANRQAAEGHDVHVAGAAGAPLADELDPAVTYHGFATRLFRGFRVHRLMARLRADICHGHLSAGCKVLGGAAGRQLSVATLHVGYKTHQHGRLDGLICVNRTQASRLDGFRGTMRVIPNWMPSASRTPAGPGIRQELGIAPDTFLVGAVGRLHPSKGMDVLIKAFIVTAPANAALVIAGEGPQRAELERLRGDDARIFLPGHVPAIDGCLRDLDLFVSPSREESFGLAILEAMGRSLPVIATSAEGPGEFLLDHPVELVPPGSVGLLARALAEARDKFAAGRLARVAYNLEAFDQGARVASITDFYGQVIDADRRVRRARQIALAA